MSIEGNNNSASRARCILLNASQQSDRISVLHAWANVLVPDHDENIDHFEVVKLINSLREEILIVKAEAEICSLPNNLYENFLEKALNATQVDNLQGPWSNYCHHITDEVLLCFGFCAHIIAKDEFSFEDQDIDEIEEAITDLKKKIESGKVEPLLKHFITSQIETIRHSLNEYRIRGTKSFKSTYISGISQIVENEDLIRQNSTTSEITSLKKIWEKIKSSTEAAAKANKAIDSWTKLIEKGSDVIDYLS